MLKQFFFIPGREADEVRNEPAAVVAVTVEERYLKIPVGDLENMEFFIDDRYKFKVSFLEFADEQREIIGNVVTGKVIIDVLRVVKGLVDVHKINLMAHRMQEILQVGGIAQVCEIRIEFVAVSIRQHPLVTSVLLFDPHVQDNVDRLLFPGKCGCDLTVPVPGMKIKENRGFFIQHILDEHCFLICINQGAVLIKDHIQVPSPGLWVPVTVLPGIKPGTAYIFFGIETPEELVHLLGLGIKYAFVTGNAANIVLRPGNEGRKQQKN